jgi:hypothetical protein
MAAAPIQLLGPLAAVRPGIANGGILSPVRLSRCNIRSMRERAWPRQCVEQMQMAIPPMHSGFEAEH